MINRLFHIRGPMRDSMSFGYFLGTGFTSGIDHVNQVGPALSMQGMYIEISNKTATEHGYFFALHHSFMFCQV
jgi:hypothetical protein